MSRARLCERFERLCDEVSVSATQDGEEAQRVWADSFNQGPWEWEAVGTIGLLGNCSSPTASGFYPPLNSWTPNDNIQYMRAGCTWDFPCAWHFGELGAGGSPDFAGDMVGNGLYLTLIGPGTITIHTATYGGSPRYMIALMGAGTNSDDIVVEQTIASTVTGSDIRFVIPNDGHCSHMVMVTDTAPSGGGKWGFAGFNWVALSGAYIGIDTYGAFVRGTDNVRVGSPRGLFNRTHPFTLYVRFQTTVLGRTGFPGLYPLFTVDLYGPSPNYVNADGYPSTTSVSVAAYLRGPEWTFPTYPRLRLSGETDFVWLTDDFPWGDHDWSEGTWYWLAIEVVPGQSINVRIWQDCTEGTETIVLSNDGLEDTIPVPLEIDQIELLFGLGNGSTINDKIRVGFIGIEEECPYFRDYLDPEEDLLLGKPVTYATNTGTAPNNPAYFNDQPYWGQRYDWPPGVWGAGYYYRDTIVDLGETTTLTHFTVGFYGHMGDRQYWQVAMSGGSTFPGDQTSRGWWSEDGDSDIWPGWWDFATWRAYTGQPLIGRYFFLRHWFTLGGLGYNGGYNCYGAAARRATPCSPTP
jgi:hypothetical protein